MVYYDGNRVAYGSGGSWNVAVDVWDSGPTTAGTVTVFYSYNVYFSTSISDSSNTINWSDPWGSGSANNTAFSGGAGMRLVSGVHQQTYSIKYGATTPIYFRMYATGMATGGTGPSVAEFAHHLPARLPSVPSAQPIYVSSITSSSATLSSGYTSGENGALIDSLMYRLNTSAGVVVGDKTGGWGGVSFTGLTRGASYTAYVRAHNSAGWGPWSAGKAFTVLATAPDAPATPTVTGISQTAATVNWVAPANGGSALSGFHVQVDDSTGFGSPHLDTTVSSTDTSLTVSGLTLNTTYYARVRTWNKSGYSSWSATRTFTTSPGTPLAPGTPTVSGISGVAASLAWGASTARGSAVTGYLLQVDDDSGFSAPLVLDTSTAANTRTYALTNLVPNTTYYVRARATSAVGNGAWSAVLSFRTNAGFYITVGGVPKEAVVYITVGGVPKLADVYLSVGGTPRLI